jgi:hypothetical protein
MASKIAAISNKRPKRLYYSTQSDGFSVKSYVFGDKEFIEMMYYIVEGLIARKIQDGRPLKQ